MPDPTPTDPFTEQEAEDFAYAANNAPGSPGGYGPSAGQAVGAGLAQGEIEFLKLIAAWIRTHRG